MTLYENDVTCVICGKVHEEQFVSSYSNFHRPDLDYRPSEMGRNTMVHWLQTCPECGLVAPSVEDERKIGRDFLESEEYKNCRGRKIKSWLAEKFFKYYIISDREGYVDECMDSALHAAWACDDIKDKENSDYFRELVLPESEWLIDYYEEHVEENERYEDLFKKTMLIRADVLRRLGRFDEVIEEYEDVFFEGEDDRMLNQAVAFHLRKAREKDAGCYTFEDVLNEPVRTNIAEAREKLFQIPPDFSGFDDVTPTPAQATELASEYAELCWQEGVLETDDLDFSYEGYLSWCNKDPAIIPYKHSTFLYEVMDFLLQFGMDPNYVKNGDWSLMEHVMHVVNGYIAADTLKLLLEKGGDPNLALENGTVFGAIDHDVGYDTSGQIDRRAYDSLVHCWMVLIAYGGKPRNGSTPLDLFDEWQPKSEARFDLEKLKNHKNYSFAITHSQNRGSSPTIHIFDKRTYWEVARL